MQYTSDDALAVAENKILMLYILEKVNKDIAYKVYLELVTTLTERNFGRINTRRIYTKRRKS